MYAGAKAAVHHLSRALSLEWAKSGVIVNVVAPCITETDSRKVILERPGYKEWATTEMLPAGRWNQPEDLVGAVLFLSSHLSDMVVGHVLMVDGGWTIHWESAALDEILFLRSVQNFRDVAAAVSWSRRQFLRDATGACLGTALLSSHLKAAQMPRNRKAVVVTFGGGARDEETFMPDGQENIPHLLSELIPQATFFTQVVNRGILGHYVADGQPGHRRVRDLQQLRCGPAGTSHGLRILPQGPSSGRPPTPGCCAQQWLRSDWRKQPRPSFGPGLGASVVLPKRLLTAAISGSGTRYEHLLHDNYETPLYHARAGGRRD